MSLAIPFQIRLKNGKVMDPTNQELALFFCCRNSLGQWIVSEQVNDTNVSNMIGSLFVCIREKGSVNWIPLEEVGTQITSETFTDITEENGTRWRLDTNGADKTVITRLVVNNFPVYKDSTGYPVEIVFSYVKNKDVYEIKAYIRTHTFPEIGIPPIDTQIHLNGDCTGFLGEVLRNFSK